MLFGRRESPEETIRLTRRVMDLLAEGKSDEEVQRALRRHLPDGSPPEAVKAFAARERFECSDLTAGVIYCSTRAPGGFLFFIAAKWLMEFHFADGRLARIQVRKGLTGP